MGLKRVDAGFEEIRMSSDVAVEAPRLRRTLTLWNLVIIGIVIIQPIAPMGIYGVISNAAGGPVVTTILIAMVSVFLSGWAMFMYYILNPVICTIICSQLTQNILPGAPYWALAVFYAVFFTALNLRGVRTSARINDVLAAG